VKRIRSAPTNLIATILVAMSLFSLAFALVESRGAAEISSPLWFASTQPLPQINLTIDKPTPTPHATPTAKVGAGSLALQGETVPQARGSAPRNPCYTADNGKAYVQQSYQLSVGSQALPLTISLAVAPAVINAGQTTTVTLATNGSVLPRPSF
jgi:hypothetical protein